MTTTSRDVAQEMRAIIDAETSTIPDEQWAMIWLTGEQQGIGASRSQGCGRYEITQ